MPELMTVEELALYLRFTRKTLYRLLKQGAIPAIKIGNKWRFDKEVIDKWLRHGMEEVRSRILVIDDDELIRSLFKETLEEQGHTVITAGTGAEGIERVKQWDFGLVFLDLKMPGMDGEEFLRQLKSIKPELPVTVITGYPGSEIMERALKQGPFGVMNKPFNISDIINAVNSFLKVKQSRKGTSTQKTVKKGTRNRSDTVEAIRRTAVGTGSAATRILRQNEETIQTRRQDNSGKFSGV